MSSASIFGVLWHYSSGSRPVTLGRWVGFVNVTIAKRTIILNSALIKENVFAEVKNVLLGVTTYDNHLDSTV